jgi:DNA polymerase IV
MNPAILHVDMDAFFASVEQLDNPQLRGQPVMVGGSAEGRGVVAAASYEARRYGVHSAMSAARARQLCPQGVLLPVRMNRYAAVSKQVFDIFGQFTDRIEGLSIDEAFLDISGSQRLLGPAEDIGRQVKARILQQLGLIASVGLASNKFLAKVASDLEKPDGFVVVAPGTEAEFMAPLSIERIWGIGRVTAGGLRAMGIDTAASLLCYPAENLRGVLGSGAEAVLELARGIDRRSVETGCGHKSIGAETTFNEDLADAQELDRVLVGLTDRVAGQLRTADYLTRTVSIKARYADFTTCSRSRSLKAGISATRQILEIARRLLTERLGRGGRALRLLGVSLSNLQLQGQNPRQAEMFADEGDTKRETLDRTIDNIRQEFGNDSVRPGNQFD